MMGTKPRKISPTLRNKVFERDGWKCRNPKCRSREYLTIHHIVYKSKLGHNSTENCVTLCGLCQTGSGGIHNGAFIIRNVHKKIKEIDANGRIKFVYATGETKEG